MDFKQEQESDQSEERTKMTQRNFNILINNKHFVTSMVEILDLLTIKSSELDLNSLDLNVKQNIRSFKDHTRLRKSCAALKYNFTSQTPEHGFTEAPIIKKIYRTLTQNLSKFFPEPSTELFCLHDDNGAVVTIIPSIDMGLVTKNMSPEELNTLWGYLYMLYISSVGMILEANEHKKEGKVWDILPSMREKVVKMGLMKDGKIFNPFIGLQVESGNYNIETMFENVEKSTPSGPNIEDMLKLTGVDKLIDIGNLKEQLNNVKQEDINDATKNITKLLGAEDDQDINDVCSTLVEGIVAKLQSNPDGGIKNLFEITGEITKTMGDKLDKDKMAKTATKLFSFLQNGESNLRNMTDDKGNPIGEKIMKSLEIPLKFAQNFQPGQTPNLAQYQSMMAHVNQTVSQMKEENAKK
jgi:hypothetical protein